MAHDPYRVESRKPLTPKQRTKLFLEHDGRCCICQSKIKVGEAWVDEHVKPLWLNGTNDMDNRAPAHADCALTKTRKETTQRAKGRRVAEKHFAGRQSKGPPMPGTKRSRWKKKMDGTVVER
jgi:5-methylcytosine-specific restriction endonuclease McrA